MKLSNILLAAILLFSVTSCRVKRDVQLENLKTLYVQKFDYSELDSTIEYTEIERIYTYSPDADSGINETTKPALTITEKLRSYKKTGSTVKVEKSGEVIEEIKTKVTSKEKQTDKVGLVLVVTLVLVGFVLIRILLKSS